MPQETSLTPTTRLLAWPDVHARITLCRATVWTLRKSGKFPEPVRVSSGRIAWRESEIDDWIRSRPIEEHS